MADPWFKFYPSDWRNDPALKMCSMAARGLWIELICLMHQATPYGHLLVNGQAPTDAQIAVLVGAPSDQIAALLGELESAGIFSRTRNGIIYSRKLTRMSKKAATARNNGRKGGNPSLSNERQNAPSDNQKVKGWDKPQRPEPEPEPDIRVEDTNVSLSVSTDAPCPANDISHAVSRYNQAAERAGWPQVQKLTPSRSKQLRARLKDCGGLEGWEDALRRAYASDFCRGRTPKPWTGFGFDWLTKAANFTKLMEGNYDNRSDNPTATGGNAYGNKQSASIASIVARRRNQHG